jgi:protein subunit release factor B
MTGDNSSEIILPVSDDELMGECDVTTFRSSGPGGQHVNKTDSAVRMVHRPSGIVVISRQERSQYLNKKVCLARLRDKVETRNRKDPPRIETKIPRAAKRERLDRKKIDSSRKQMRRKVSGDE